MKAAEILNRRKKISELLYEKEVIKVTELVKLLNVSDETIRKDLAYLEEEGIIEKKHGKATLIKEKQLEPVLQRTPVNLVKKKALVKKALTLIQEEDLSIGLDQGSTIALLATQLKALPKKQIFTGSLAAILELVNSEHALHCFGGQYSAEDMAFRNEAGKEMYPDIHFDVCFFGSSGVKNRQGFCTSSLVDAQAKRMMLRKSTKNIVLLDETKFQSSSLVQVVPWDEVDLVITNKGISSELATTIRQACDLILVDE
jgi:DeoR/GlpR family transcriptional regulator of sugar metabolism